MTTSGPSYHAMAEQIRRVTTLSTRIQGLVDVVEGVLDRNTARRPDMAPRRWEIRRNRIKEDPRILEAAEDRSLAIQLAIMHGTAANAAAITHLAGSVQALSARLDGLITPLAAVANKLTEALEPETEKEDNG